MCTVFVAGCRSSNIKGVMPDCDCAKIHNYARKLGYMGNGDQDQLFRVEGRRSLTFDDKVPNKRRRYIPRTVVPPLMEQVDYSDDEYYEEDSEEDEDIQLIGGVWKPIVKKAPRNGTTTKVKKIGETISLMVTTGLVKGNRLTKRTEVLTIHPVNTKSIGNSFRSLDYPLEVRGAVGVKLTPLEIDSLVQRGKIVHGGNSFMICGGLRQTEISTKECFIADIEDGQWRYIDGEHMQEARAFASACRVQPKGVLWVAGGGSSGSSILRSSETFSDGWQLLEHRLPIPMSQHSVVRISIAKFLLTGGVGKEAETAFLVDLPGFNFHLMKRMPRRRVGHVAFNAIYKGQRAVIFAGGTTKETTKSSDVMYISQNKNDSKNHTIVWSQKPGPDLPKEVSFGTAIRIQGRTLIVGGNLDDGRLIEYKNDRFFVLRARLRIPRQQAVVLKMDEQDR